MRKRAIFAVLVSATLCATGSFARAQQTGQPASNSSNLPDSPVPAPATKDKSKTAPAPATTPAATDTQDATPQAPAKKPSTADDNPFPEDVSKAAAAEAKAAAKPPSTSNVPAKSSEGGSSADNPDKPGVDDPSRSQLKLESPDGATDIYDPKRATEDVRVGRFYLKAGDFKGAYDRFKDAASFDHEDAEAVFWLAEAARKMKLDQEAEQNYQIYLEAMPNGPNAKVARKALGELASVRKP
jgi:tetratricopeptide (TPR) repeat protein